MQSLLNALDNLEGVIGMYLSMAMYAFIHIDAGNYRIFIVITETNKRHT